MIRTMTFITCDTPGCANALAGDCDGHHNREANTVASARNADWKRVYIDGPHGTLRFADYCAECLKDGYAGVAA